MRVFLTLWRREMAQYFLSPIAYVTAFFFLVIMGFSFWMLVSVMLQGAAGVTVMEELFGRSIFFWLALLISAPVLSMRLFAEEKRSGTMEALLTAPVSEVAVVLAKYAGALTFFIVMWLPTASYAVILRGFSPQTAPPDLGPMAAGYVGAFLVGAFYLAVGLLCSVLTRNQVIAAISTFALLLVCFLSGFIPYLARVDLVRDVGAYFSSVQHMMDFSRGALDTRPVVLYVTATAWLLFATVKVLESRKWK